MAGGSSSIRLCFPSKASSGQCEGPEALLAAHRVTSCSAVLLQELCLYTLGNLVVESEAVRKQLLPQGIIPVLASCIQVGETAQQHFCCALERLFWLSALLPAVGKLCRGLSLVGFPCARFQSSFLLQLNLPHPVAAWPVAQGALSPLPGLGPAGLWFAGPNAQTRTSAVFGLSPVNMGRGLSSGVVTGSCVPPGPLCALSSPCSAGFAWHPGSVRGISSVPFACSPPTRQCWKVWAMSSHSSSKPRKPPQRSSRESEPLNPAPGWAPGP